jgi:hypothetical protein
MIPSGTKETQFYLKEFVEPEVLMTILEFNKYQTSIDSDLRMIVVGGAAIDLWLKSQSTNARTNDFDLRLIYPSHVYDENWKLTIEESAKMMAEALRFQKMLAHRLNLYAMKHIDELRDLLETYDIQLQVKDIFYTHRPWENLLIIAWKLKQGNDVTLNNIVDIFPISNFANESYWQMEAFRSDVDLQNKETNYPIPTQMFFGVDYAALGYCMWDLYHLIKFEVKKESGKVERNEGKFRSIIRALNAPAGRLDCFLMQEFVKTCETEINEVCTFAGETLTAEEVLKFGTEWNLFPNAQGARIQEIANALGTSYLCHYIQRYQDRIFVKL